MASRQHPWVPLMLPAANNFVSVARNCAQRNAHLQEMSKLKVQFIDWKVWEKVEDLQLKLSSVPRSLTGSMVLAAQTVQNYGHHLRQLGNFLGYIQDWESFKILRPESPSFFPVARVENKGAACTCAQPVFWHTSQQSDEDFRQPSIWAINEIFNVSLGWKRHQVVS